jgi:two-component system LytT family sensor kinase
MKVRWREHEAVLIIMIAAIFIAGYTVQMLSLTPQQIKTEYAVDFVRANTTFSYFGRVLLPQTGSILFLLLCYFWINWLIVPRLSSPGKKSVGTFLLAALQFLVIVYLTGPLVNFISFYINPYYLSNPAYQSYIPLTFGSHPQPYKNSFGGIGEAFTLIFAYAVYAGFREAVIKFMEARESRRTYRIFILNQITVFLAVFFAAPVFTSTFHLVINPAYYNGYFAFIPPVLLTFTTNTYVLFPLKGERTFFRWQLTAPLLLSTFIYMLFFSMFLGSDWSIVTLLCCWAVLLFVISPISWLDFQQRKDKILQLRGVEKELVKSKADLQFLRSQINPHFLFNALNTLYGTALVEGSKNTAEGIQKLGDMMRFMLHENNQDFIRMDKEIEYLRNYIALQKLRTQLSPDISVDESIDEHNCDCLIAPMLLIPFIENAFKHGISLKERSWIKIRLGCDEENIIFEVRNSVHQKQENDPEREHSGIGLKNVQERLLLLFKGKQQFIYGIEGDEFVARLTIPKIKERMIKVKLF